MKQYNSYKPSGVEWIGDIPENWNLLKLKHEYKIQKGRIPKTISEKEDEGLVPYLSMEVLRGSDTSSFVSNEDGVFVSEGQTLILWDGSNSGEIIKVKKEGILSSTMGVLNKIGNKLNEDFSFYQLKSHEPEIRNNTNGMGIPHVDGQYVRSLVLLTPPLQEQEQIVNYLDEKITIIDKLISTKQRKVELLKEQRTTIINQVITKGLNSNVKMKNSGVEWIGEIPESWIVGKLNFYCDRIGDGLHSTPIYDDNGEYHFINGNNIKNGKVIITENTRKVNEVEFNNHFIKLSNSHTLLLSINGTIGNVSYYNDEKVILGKSVGYINLKHSSVDIDFLYWLLLSKSIQNYFQYELTGTTIYNLSLNSIRKTPILIPSSKEQREIVEYLDNHTKDIDDLVCMEQKKIELLKEYRQSLISEVITGKIKVI
jgi:type I restriction enzyme S subunit